MIVNACLHKTGKTKVVLNVDVENRVFVNLAELVPMGQQELGTLTETVCANNVKSVAAISVLEIDINLLL